MGSLRQSPVVIGIYITLSIWPPRFWNSLLFDLYSPNWNDAKVGFGNKRDKSLISKCQLTKLIKTKKQKQGLKTLSTFLSNRQEAIGRDSEITGEHTTLYVHMEVLWGVNS